MEESGEDGAGGGCDSSKPTRQEQGKVHWALDWFQTVPGATAADTADCVGASWRTHTLPQTWVLQQLWNLYQVMNQKAIFVPTHLGTEPQLAPTSLSDFEGSGPGCTHPGN